MSSTGAHNSQFEDLMEPLDMVITLIYKRELSFELPEFFNKYRQSCLQHQPAIDELEILIKRCISKCLLLVSKKYIKQLNMTFSDDGLIYYIYSGFNSLVTSEIESMLASIPPSK